MYLSWDPSYSTSIATFDDQHKKLFQLINDLHEGMRAKKTKEAIGTALGGLLEYTKTHFAAEEKQMTATGYPDLAAHLEQHHAFIEHVNEVNTRYRNGDPIMTVEVIGFLVDWLKTHIQVTDKEYGPHLTKYGVR